MLNPQVRSKCLKTKGLRCQGGERVYPYTLIYTYIYYVNICEKMSHAKNARDENPTAEKFNSETFAKSKVGLDRGGRYSYLVRGRQVLVAPTLRAGIGPSETSRFLADSQSIPSQFSANFDFNSFKRIHDEPNTKGPNHISWPICQCEFAKITRLKDMMIPAIEWTSELKGRI